jgi:uncharacterized MAPEG superfamily protein
MSFFADLLRKLPSTNPITSIFYVFGLAYIPHFIKVMAMSEKKKKEGRGAITNNDVGDSRYLCDKAMDGSPDGLYIARCFGAHMNGLEAFSYYSAAVLASLHAGVDSALLGGAATAFVAVRALYNIVYLTPLNGALRSAVFGTGLSISALLFYTAGNKYQHK